MHFGRVSFFGHRKHACAVGQGLWKPGSVANKYTSARYVADFIQPVENIVRLAEEGQLQCLEDLALGAGNGIGEPSLWSISLHLLRACQNNGDLHRYLLWHTRLQGGEVALGHLRARILEDLAKAGDAKLAGHLLDEYMAEGDCGHITNAATLGALIDSCAKAGLPEEARKWLGKADALGVEANSVMYTSVIDAYARRGKAREAADWLGRMEVARQEPDIVAYTSVIDAFGKNWVGR